MKTEFIPELGKIQISKRKQSKRITIRYDPKGFIKVSLPKNVSYKAGFDYICSKKFIIQNKIARLREEQSQVDLDGYSTKWHNIILQPKDINRITYQIDYKKTTVQYPYHKDLKDPVLQSVVREAIEETLRKEAKSYLSARINKLAAEHNLKFNNLYIKNVKTLWGSCSSKNNINLNIHLMRLPGNLIDYVLLHELCHTIHKNHSSRFWNLLESLLKDDIMKLKKELRTYTPRI